MYSADLYCAKTANASYNRKKVGDEVKGFDKIMCGCFCSTLIMCLLVGPFFLFSGMGVTTMFNPI